MKRTYLYHIRSKGKRNKKVHLRKKLTKRIFIYQNKISQIFTPIRTKTTDVHMLHTVFMSGLAVTICLSAGKDLFCLNSTSPATIRIVNTRYWHKNLLKTKQTNKILFLPLNIKIKF